MLSLDSDNYGLETFKYIVFLDIDGVMNHIHMKSTYHFLEESVEVLNYLYEKYNIEIVISSSWRYAYSFKFIKKLCKDNGIKAEIIDKTYICTSNDKINIDLSNFDIKETPIYMRENEIYEWIKIFKPKHFIILDDYKMKNDFLLKHQLITNYFGNNLDILALRKKDIPIIENILAKENELFGENL